MFSKPIDQELSLAILQPSFAKEYVKIFSDNKDYFGKWLAFPHFANAGTEPFFLDFVKDSLSKFGAGTALVCAIIYQNDSDKSEWVGNISFNSINNKTKVAEIGYWLRQDMQGRGIITRAVEKMIDIGFEELGMTKIQISCATENTASRSVPERLGFTLEGIITQTECINGNIYDHAVYGFYKDE